MTFIEDDFGMCPRKRFRAGAVDRRASFFLELFSQVGGDILIVFGFCAPLNYREE